MKKPYTKEEQEVANLLVEAHNKFMKLEVTHPSDKAEWIISLHRLQDILGGRVLRRDYPNFFFTQKEK